MYHSTHSTHRPHSTHGYYHSTLHSTIVPEKKWVLCSTGPVLPSTLQCNLFEAGHGLSATTIAQARVQVTRRAIDAEGGRDGDTLEDVDEFFDQSDIKEQFELAMRMVEVTRSTSEWHRRMTTENLGQHGQVVNLNDLPVGSKAYVYKPPT